MAVSVMLAGLGSFMEGVLFLLVWPQQPFEWISPKSVFWSIMTGAAYGFGMFQYIVCADTGLPASIAGPISGLHVLVPPLWYVVFFQRCIGGRTALGFLLSIISLVLFSGLLSETGSMNISTDEWVNLIAVIVSWGIGIITQGEAGKKVSFKQFPQVNSWISIGYAGTCLIQAFAVSFNQSIEQANWEPFGFDHVLGFLSAFFLGSGTAFFSLCLVYADDFNLMVALTSLNIAVPAICGMGFLHEPATVDVLLGLVFASGGVIILSLDAKGIIADSPIHKRRRQLPSMSSVHLEPYPMPDVDDTPLLSS